VHIDVWSDVICPWCFLGSRRLSLALDELGWTDDVEVRWRAYQLDPRATAEPGDLKAALERKYGPGAFHGMTRRLTVLGEPVGIDYRFDRAQRVNTRDAHRLLAWAWDEGGPAAQSPLAERLFRAYFEEGENVADQVVLARLAGDAELHPAEATRALSAGLFADEVDADLVAAEERGLTGVPAFVIEDKVLIPGAQEVETFVAVLQRAKERLAS